MRRKRYKELVKKEAALQNVMIALGVWHRQDVWRMDVLDKSDPMYKVFEVREKIVQHLIKEIETETGERDWEH
ncbi:MAG: hypothetical protein J6S67_00600 [Methanobrevibacter sp.]|nr:hypothetical protein [Methanobrevibacter sp.]